MPQTLSSPESGAKFAMRANVIGVADPRTPGRTAYEVSAASGAVVQGAITELMEGDGVAVSEFTNPRRTENGLWVSIGYTIKRESPNQ